MCGKGNRSGVGSLGANLSFSRTAMAAILGEQPPTSYLLHSFRWGPEEPHKIQEMEQDMVTHTCNPNIWKLEAGGLLQVWPQEGLQ